MRPSSLIALVDIKLPYEFGEFKLPEVARPRLDTQRVTGTRNLRDQLTLNTPLAVRMSFNERCDTLRPDWETGQLTEDASTSEASLCLARGGVNDLRSKWDYRKRGGHIAGRRYGTMRSSASDGPISARNPDIDSCVGRPRVGPQPDPPAVWRFTTDAGIG